VEAETSELVAEGRTVVAPTCVRIGVVGDVHGQDAALDRALDFFRRRGADAVLCVGDLIDGPGDVGRVIELLREGGVHVVAGNHERWFLHDEQRRLDDATLELPPDARAFLEALPVVRRFATPAGGLLLGHGVGEDDMAELRPETKGYALQDIPTLRELMLDPEVAYVIGGHTHQRMVRRFQGITFLNAGTLLPAQDPCVLWVDFEARTYAFHDASPRGDMSALEEGSLPEPAPLPDL
jgi:predicted phosphodiesterase